MLTHLRDVKPSFEERLKAEDDVLRNINHLTQRWENRITARRLRLAQRFLNLELHILLHLRVIKSGKCWGVSLEQEIPIKPVCKENEIVRTWSERTMLVDSIKLVDSPKAEVPAFVWFQEIEGFYRFWPDAIYKSGLPGFVTREILRNGETVPVGNPASATTSM